MNISAAFSWRIATANLFRLLWMLREGIRNGALRDGEYSLKPFEKPRFRFRSLYHLRVRFHTPIIRR